MKIYTVIYRTLKGGPILEQQVLGTDPQDAIRKFRAEHELFVLGVQDEGKLIGEIKEKI